MIFFAKPYLTFIILYTVNSPYLPWSEKEMAWMMEENEDYLAQRRTEST